MDNSTVIFGDWICKVCMDMNIDDDNFSCDGCAFLPTSDDNKETEDA